MLLTELLEAQDAVGRLLGSFLSTEDQFPLLSLNRAVVHCSLRRAYFASASWAIPERRWLAIRVLRNFSMKNVVTSVILYEAEWQQPLLVQFPALRKIKIVSTSPIEIFSSHFSTTQITSLDLSECIMTDLSQLAAFSNLETLLLPFQIYQTNFHSLESLQSLRRLSLGYKNRSGKDLSLTFLEKLPNLTELEVASEETDLFPLIHLKKLEKLNISGCAINDMQPLMASTSALKLLRASQTYFFGQQIPTDDITAYFASLVNLQVLELCDSQLLEDVGLSSLTPLVNLTELVLGSELYDDLSPLAAFTKLKTLRIRAKLETDWTPIAKLKKLETLDQQAPFVTVDAIAAQVLTSLPNLKELVSPVAISPNCPLPQVYSLKLTSRIKEMLMSQDISLPIDEICPNIAVLQLSGCFDLSRLGLSNLKKLKDLVLFSLETSKVVLKGGRPVLPVTHLIDYSPIANLHSLKRLALSRQCKAKDYKFLKSLVNLRELNLYGQWIAEISALTDMPHLEVLTLSHSTIQDISPLGSLRKLKQLYLENTNVKDVSCLRGLPHLNVLKIPETADCSPLLDEYGASLPSITVFSHFGHANCNPLDFSEANS